MTRPTCPRWDDDPCIDHGGSHAVECHACTLATRLDERAAVVAFIRDQASKLLAECMPSDAHEAEIMQTVRKVVGDYADAIERVEHRNK